MSELIARTADNFTEVALSENEKALLNNYREQLNLEGENIEFLQLSEFDDSRLLSGLLKTESNTGLAVKELLRHSLRFSRVKRDSIMTGRIEIPQSVDNVHPSGRARRHEEGRIIDLEKVRQQDIDPSKVLYYRVTQPSDIPKPEYYWTSDFREVQGGLEREIGSEQSATAVIIVSTLDKIAENGGLIEDVNDDQGIAVRQIGLRPFSQNEALFSFSRNVRLY